MISLAKRKLLPVVDLKGAKANRKEFVSRLTKVSCRLVFFNGHGSARAVAGYNNEILVDANDNVACLAGRIVFARCCSAARILGPKSLAAGTEAFLGYTEPFVFMYDLRVTSRPLLDKTAGLFLEPANLVITTLIKGHSAIEAHQRSLEAYRRRITDLLNSEVGREDTAALRWLIWDRQHQVCLGNSSAKL